jgi:hypothetical protein
MTDSPTPTEDLVAALASMQDPPKTGTSVGGRTYSYLTLPDLLSEARTKLGEHRIAVMQHWHALPAGGVSVTTTLLHSSGHTWVTDPAEQPSQRDPQSVGSALTYIRRYQLAALLGLSGSDDDDAQAAPKPEATTVQVRSRKVGDTEPTTRPPTVPGAVVQPSTSKAQNTAARDQDAPTAPGRPPTVPPALRPVTGDQLTLMHTLITQLEHQSGERMDPDTRRSMIRNLLHLEVLDSAKDLTRSQASEAIDILQALTQEESPAREDGGPSTNNPPKG